MTDVKDLYDAVIIGVQKVDFGKKNFSQILSLIP